MMVLSYPSTQEHIRKLATSVLGWTVWGLSSIVLHPSPFTSPFLALRRRSSSVANVGGSGRLRRSQKDKKVRVSPICDMCFITGRVQSLSSSSPSVAQSELSSTPPCPTSVSNQLPISVVCFSSASPITVTTGDKVELSLYYEALCPYCENFILNYLYKIFDNGLISIVDLKLSPYGNAKIRSNGTIVCQI
ncbi:putative gamma interferon inducible lysosomal thiol reductase GILT [Helianthus debilis subsp. tardiflorus]